VVSIPLKNDGVKVSWDDDIPKIWKVKKNHVPNHQLVDVAVCQNLVPLVNIKIAGKWMFIPLKMVLIGIDPYPYFSNQNLKHVTSDSVSHNPVTAGF